MKQATLGYEQNFFINGTKMSGVQSVQGSYSISEKPINIVGWGHVNSSYFNSYLKSQEGLFLDENGFRVIQENKSAPQSMAVLDAPLEGNFSIESILISEDFFMQYTGENPFTGSIHHDDKYFGFNGGYISSHSISCSVGEIPKTSTSIRVFGNIGGNPDRIEKEDGLNLLREDGGQIIKEDVRYMEDYNASGEIPFPEIRVTNQRSISIECGGSKTDRVVDFSHTIEMPIEPLYAVGSVDPVQVDIVWPFTTTSNFTLDVDQYQYENIRKYLQNPKLEDLTIQINDCFGELIQKYSVKEARLISESMSASVDGRTTVNLTYKSYHNKR